MRLEGQGRVKRPLGGLIEPLRYIDFCLKICYYIHSRSLQLLRTIFLLAKVDATTFQHIKSMKITFHCTLTQPGTINGTANADLETSSNVWDTPQGEKFEACFKTLKFTCDLELRGSRVIRQIMGCELEEIEVVGHPIICHIIAMQLCLGARYGAQKAYISVFNSVPAEGTTFSIMLEDGGAIAFEDAELVEA